MRLTICEDGIRILLKHIVSYHGEQVQYADELSFAGDGPTALLTGG
jgi:hypothetical protein